MTPYIVEEVRLMYEELFFIISLFMDFQSPQVKYQVSFYIGLSTADNYVSFYSSSIAGVLKLFFAEDPYNCIKKSCDPRDILRPSLI
jgi:hypothetical protein